MKKDVEDVGEGVGRASSTLTAAHQPKHSARFPPSSPGQLPEKDPRRYEIIGEHGRGGIGRVIEAIDNELDRVVALKELHYVSRSSEARFLREAKITARLEHPSIVPVHEAGRWPDGRPFYAMKLVSGRSLKELIGETTTLEQRLALLPHVLAVAEAVAYAHNERIIHRDLKPSNVIVGDYGETVVIDWGLAKDLADENAPDIPAGPYRAAKDGELTAVGNVIGTPAYMPPEQARGEPVDERVDVYALGAILHHTLGGETPYPGHTPQQVLDLLCGQPPAVVREYDDEIPEELAAIIERAMAKETSDRYGTAKELADELRRYQSGQLVRAHAYSRHDLIVRWIRQHRAAVTAAAVALVATAVVAVVAFHSVRVERDVAQDERRRAELASERAVAERNQLVLAQARSALKDDPTTAIGWLKQYPVTGRDWTLVASIAADARSRGVSRHVLKGHLGQVTDLALTPNGALATVSTDGTLRLWKLGESEGEVLSRSVREESKVEVSDTGWVAWLAPDGLPMLKHLETGSVLRLTDVPDIIEIELSPDERTLALADKRGGIFLWHLEQRRLDIVGHHTGAVYELVYSVDGRLLASAGLDRAIRLWDVAKREELYAAGGDAFKLSFAFAPDGERLVVAEHGGAVKLWEPAKGRWTELIKRRDSVEPPKLSLAASNSYVQARYSPDGRRFVVAETGRSVRVWAGEGPPKLLQEFESEAWWVAFSPNGRFLAIADGDGVVRIEHLSSRTTWLYRGHGAPVFNGAFSSDGRLIVTAGQRPEVRIWTMPPAPADPIPSPGEPVFHIAYTASGDRVVGEGRDGAVWEWTLPETEPKLLGAHDDMAWGLAMSRDTRFAATASWDGSVRVWDLENNDRHKILRGHEGAVTCLAFSQSDYLVVSGGVDGAIWVWNTESGDERMLSQSEASISAVAFVPHTDDIAAASKDGTVSTWSIESGTHDVLHRHRAPIDAFAVSPDGRFIGSGSRDGEVRIWDAQFQLLAKYPDHDDMVLTAVFSPKGDRLATGARDGTVSVRNLFSGEQTVFSGHGVAVEDVVFSSDGRLMASAAQDGSTRLWELDTRRVAIARFHEASISDIVFSPDDKAVATTSWDRTIRIWPVAVAEFSPSTPEAVKDWLSTLTDFTFPSAPSTKSRFPALR